MHPAIAALLTLVGMALTVAGTITVGRMSARASALSAQIQGESQFRGDLLRRVTELEAHARRQDEVIVGLRERIATQDGIIASLREENRDLRDRLQRYQATQG